jgi:Amiloride-sensitive sodium channel
VLSTSIGICYFLTSKLFQKFQHPIAVSLEQPISVDTLPFPAITFLEPIYRSKEFLTREVKRAFLSNLNKTFINEYVKNNNLVETFLTQIVVCAKQPYLYKYPFENYENAFVPTLLNFSYAHHFDKQEAMWNSQFETVFAKRLTSQGFGYSFNILDVNEILNIDK